MVGTRLINKESRTFAFYNKRGQEAIPEGLLVVDNKLLFLLFRFKS